MEAVPAMGARAARCRRFRFKVPDGLGACSRSPATAAVGGLEATEEPPARSWGFASPAPQAATPWVRYASELAASAEVRPAAAATRGPSATARSKARERACGLKGDRAAAAHFKVGLAAIST